MAYKKVSGIYKIENLINHKIYVGQSKHIKSRWNRHINELRRNEHKNKYLQRAWNKYKEENFTFKIIEECDSSSLDARERYWISFYNSNNYKFGYNQDNGGQEGKQVNEDVKERIGDREYKRGEEHVGAKLNNKDVEKIKLLMLNGNVSSEELALKYNVTTGTINHIKNGKSWIDVRPDLNEKIKKAKLCNKKKYKINLPKDKIIEIKKLLSGNETLVKDICKKFNIKQHIINQISNLERWKDVGAEYNDILVKQNKTKGSNNTSSVLIENDIIKIKEMIYNGHTNKEISEIFGVSDTLIAFIKKGKIWSHVVTDYDSEIKNRKNKSKNHNHKYNNKDIYEIKRLFIEEDMTISDISKKYNSTRHNIQEVLYNNIDFYKDIKTPYDEQVKEKLKTLKCKLTEDDVKEIKRLINEGHSNKELSDIYNINPSVISNIRHNKLWKNVTIPNPQPQAI